MHIFSFQSRVSYDDIDENMLLTLRGAMGHMQEAAILDSSRSGYSIGDVDRTHVVWMLVQWRAKLVGIAKWNDALTVETWPRTMERLKSMRNFEVYGAERQLVAVGESLWVLVNADTGRMTRITPEIAAAYELTEKDVFGVPLPEVSDGNGMLTYSGSVALRDIDTNHHVNNRIYLDYAKEALPPEWRDYPFREVSVRYRRQLLYGDPIRCYYRKADRCCVVDICGEDSEHIHATVVYYE